MPKGPIDLTSEFFQLVPRYQQDDIPADIPDDIPADIPANAPAYADECYSPTSVKGPSLLAPLHKKKDKKIGVFLSQEEIADILNEEERDNCCSALSFCSDDESC
jgi:hypothetical protein